MAKDSVYARSACIGLGVQMNDEGNIHRVPALVRHLYGIVEQFERLFPGRRFTPDGHLVGSIGEAIAASEFGIVLFDS